MKSPRIKLPHSVIVKSPGLLPMLYTVGELVDALGAVDRTLRDWLVLGAPHTRDKRGHIWIHGREFAEWVAEIQKPKRKRTLEDNEAFCLRCKETVEMLDPKTVPMRGKLLRIRGKCPQCGITINRGGRMRSNPKPLNRKIEESTRA
jgi:hypothetical protein